MPIEVKFGFQFQKLNLMNCAIKVEPDLFYLSCTQEGVLP